MNLDIVAVTGATGHLGNVLVRELLRRGKRVRALVEPGDEARAAGAASTSRWSAATCSGRRRCPRPSRGWTWSSTSPGW